MYIKPCKITLITGFLGAGKTTLVNEILQNNKGYKFAVLVNDIGEVNVDEKLIDKKGLATIQMNDLVALTNGCICCTLKNELIDQIFEIVKTQKFDHILIEASGICEPMPIVQNIALSGEQFKDQYDQQLWELDSVVCLVDAYRLKTEYNYGLDLMDKEFEEDDIGRLLLEQLDLCHTIVLNKMELLTEEERIKVYNNVAKLQPGVQIFASSYSKIDLDKILDKSSFVFEKESQTEEWKEELEHPEEHEEGEKYEYNIETFVFNARKPFDVEKFKEFVFKSKLMDNVIRSKGICWFNTDYINAYVFESSGLSRTLDPYGKWIDSARIGDKKSILKQHPELKEKWDAKYGDREQELVFIGKDLDEKAIKEDLNACLVDD